MEVFALPTPTSSGNSKAFLESWWDENVRHARAFLHECESELREGFGSSGPQ